MEESNNRLDIKMAVKAMAEYVMLNSAAAESTSLFYGRAGMSICLFETARFLNDDYIEDHAFTLLKQSLVSVEKDTSFDKGMSGVGYALSYLIRNGFIDADFNEIFQKQHNTIVEMFIDNNFNNMNLQDLISQWLLANYFHYIPDERVDRKMQELKDACIVGFDSVWKTMQNGGTSLKKELIVTLWKNYLKTLLLTEEEGPYRQIKEYLSLLRNGVLKRDVQALHIISAIAAKNPNPAMKDEICNLMPEYNLPDFYATDSMMVSRLFSEPYISCDFARDSILKSFSNRTLEEIEGILTERVGFSSSTIVLSFGVSGLILGLISLCNKDRHITEEILSII